MKLGGNDMMGARRRMAMPMAALAATLAMTVGVNRAAAQTYPDRPVKIIVPTPPGGPVDVIARLTANYLQTALGKGFVVENRAGAADPVGHQLARQRVWPSRGAEAPPGIVS